MSTGGFEPMSVIGGGGFGFVHTPTVWPGGMTQTSLVPPQQSDVAVHLPPSGTQAELPHTNLPLLSGTQVVPLQQSAEVAQVPPGITHMPTV